MKEYTFPIRPGNKQQIAEIKQTILDICTDFKSTIEISDELSINPNVILSHCKRLANYRFLEVKETVSRRGAKKYYFKTLNPVFKEVRINVSSEVEAKVFKWNPIAWMGMQPIEDKAKGRVFKIDERTDDSDYVKHLKDADKLRRDEMKSSKVYVNGNILSMAV